MLDCIARLIEPLLRLLWPAVGRHRAPLTTAVPTAQPTLMAAVAPPAVVPSIGAGRVVPCAEEEAPLVRPYVVAQERREEVRRQRARRRALWLALHGVDIGPRFIHGVEVTT
ncbi:hypothetical protein ABT174_05955 [Streptomyces sparsogenes]|uniref:hypothetical protein n=1 Tax=Streptomyces sparsogenes TaxID=67365 RepID=UPI0033333948